MWFSSDTLQILSRELPEQSGGEERVSLLKEMLRTGNNELVTGTGLIARGEEEVAASFPYHHWLWYNSQFAGIGKQSALKIVDSSSNI